MKCKNSLTADYLSGRKTISVPETRRSGNGLFLEINGACENNLKQVDVQIPLGVFTCVTGVSGSGKSSLVNEVLYKNLANALNGARKKAGKHTAIHGLEHLDKVF
jgi:excinuclease ABC subunit A